MITFPRYENYQNSGVSWIGEVPSDWQIVRAKYVFKEVDERSQNGAEELLSVSHLTGVTPRSEKTVNMFLAEDYSGTKLCRENDFVFNTMWAWMGALGCSPQAGIVSSSYGVYRLLDSVTVNPWYLDLLLRTPMYIAEYNRRSTGVNSSRLRLYPDKFLDMSILLPPKSRQDRIVTFLDAKTAEIDEAIAKKQRLIELLYEQKAILINQAVTKGLNPSVPMRDSGVPWIGEIPSHWTVLPLKRVISTKITDGPHETPKFLDNGIPFVSAEAAFDGRIHLDKARGLISIETHVKYCSKVKPQKSDIFIVKSGSTTGKVVIVDFDDEFSVWSPLALVRPNNSYFVPQFLFVSLQDSYFQKQVQTQWSQGTQPNISMGDLEKLSVISPPLSEQIRIKESLDLKFSSIHITISKIRAEVKSLLEFKSILISEAVTGKIKI